MSDSSDPFSLLDRIYRIDLSTKRGLIGATVANLLSVSATAGIIDQLKVDVPSEYFLLAIAGIEAIVVLIGIYQLWLRPFDTKTMAVAFAIKPDDESRKLNDGLNSSLQKEITRLKLSNLISVRKLPNDKFFSSGKQAEDYLRKKGLRVLIWGDADTRTRSGETVTVFNIQISYQHQPMDESNRKDLISTVQQGITRSGWIISHNETLNGTVVVSANVIEVSLYALAVCLVSVRHPDFVLNGIGVLEHLHARLEGRSEDENFPNLSTVRDKINSLLADQYSSMSVYYMMEKHDVETAYEWAMKAVNLKPSDYLWNINVAFLAWELGDEDQAQKYTAAAASIAPNESLHKLNLAFFQLVKGHYGKAVVQYKKISDTVYRTNIPMSVEFIQRRHDRTKEPSMLFAAGWVSHRFGDKTLGRQLLNEFLQEVDGDTSYKPLVKEATKELGKDRPQEAQAA
jgi:hypothetical protein